MQSSQLQVCLPTLCSCTRYTPGREVFPPWPGNPRSILAPFSQHLLRAWHLAADHRYFGFAFWFAIRTQDTQLIHSYRSEHGRCCSRCCWFVMLLSRFFGSHRYIFQSTVTPMFIALVKNVKGRQHGKWQHGGTCDPTIVLVLVISLKSHCVMLARIRSSICTQMEISRKWRFILWTIFATTLCRLLPR